jgi:cell division septation protein DedD
MTRPVRAAGEKPSNDIAAHRSGLSPAIISRPVFNSPVPILHAPAGLLCLVLLAAGLALSVSACSRQRAVSPGAAVKKEEKNDKAFQTNEEAVKAGIYEEFVDSMSLKGQTPASREGAQPAFKVKPSQDGRTPSAETPSGSAPEAALGFRVQLGAFNDQESAESLATVVREKIGNRYPVYVRYYAPLWKVLAGDCRARSEAQTLCNFVQSRGYPDAWVVSSGIKR